MAKNLKVTIDSEEFRNSFRPHMPPNRESMEETPKEHKEVSKEEPRHTPKCCLDQEQHFIHGGISGKVYPQV